MPHAIPPLQSSAFPRREAQLKALLARAQVDAAALARPLSPCQLSSCRATCCHDGVYLGEDEPSALLALLASHRPQLDALLPAPLPDRPIVPLGPPGSGRHKTATRPEPARATQPGYPRHFPATSCAFLMADSRCSLQVLSADLGHHSWHFKPFTCWLHPLALVTGPRGITTLTIHSERTDPDRSPSYPGFVAHTPCGSPCGTPGSPPASQTLAAELASLSHFAGRDLLSASP